MDVHAWTRARVHMRGLCTQERAEGHVCLHKSGTEGADQTLNPFRLIQALLLSERFSFLTQFQPGKLWVLRFSNETNEDFIRVLESTSALRPLLL